eukprot:6491933-Amphidinium_carterae.2
MVGQSSQSKVILFEVTLFSDVGLSVEHDSVCVCACMCGSVCSFFTLCVDTSLCTQAGAGSNVSYCFMQAVDNSLGSHCISSLLVKGRPSGDGGDHEEEGDDKEVLARLLLACEANLEYSKAYYARRRECEAQGFTEAQTKAQSREAGQLAAARFREEVPRCPAAGDTGGGWFMHSSM